MNSHELAAIHRAAFSVPRPWNAQEIAELLASPNCFCLTKSAGFLVGRVIADEAELLTVAIHPDERRLGHGRWLVEGFLREAQSRGAVTAFLEVAADNRVAISLYQDCGFDQTGRRKGYYAAAKGAVDALILSKSIR